MKLPTLRLLCAAVTGVFGLSCGLMSGQTAPAAKPAGEEGAVKLDPFNVSADSDVGFVAASSLAGGRIATALKDTPVAYSVITKEFLDAFNVTDMAEAANFSVNSNYSAGDNNYQGFARGPSQNVTIRGVTANQATRNFFPYVNTSDSFNIDRVDMARGANSVLFGAGGAGGTQNTATKQAMTGKPIREFRVQVGDWKRYRFTADLNQPVNDKIAVRANFLWANGDTYKVREWEEKRGVHFTTTYKLSSKLTARAEFEYRTTRNLKAPGIMQDRISAWDGKFISEGINPSVTAAQLAVAGVERFPLRLVTRPDYDGLVLNYQNRFRTKGAAYSATATNFLDGQAIKTIGFQLGKNAMFDVWDTPNRYAATKKGSPSFTIPRREENTLWDDPGHKYPTYRETARDGAAYLTYTPFEGFFIEVAADKNSAPRVGNNSGRRGQQELYLDLDRLLPTGAPNPHFLHRYSEYLVYEYQINEKFDNVRAQTAYVKDTRFGRLQVGAMAGKQDNKTIARTLTVLLPTTWLGPDMRTFVDSSQDLNVYGDYTRFYSDEGNRINAYPQPRPVTVVDPVAGVRQSVTPASAYFTQRADNNYNGIKTFKFGQVAGNFDLFKNRLVLIGAVRRDLTYVKQNRVVPPADNPAGWNGLDLNFRTAPPKDYDTLTYYPKDATGKVIDALQPADARPRSVPSSGSNFNVNMKLPQYANDRFRDDFDSPSFQASANTRTYGAVYNVTKWLGVYGNDSTTFNLNIGAQDAYGKLIAPTSSRGKDAGIRVNMPNGKLAASLGWYSAFQKNQSFKTGLGFTGAIDQISGAPVIGDLSSSGRNVRGVQQFPTNVNTTQTSDTKGYEFETTANLTSSWRLILNYATVDANVRDQYPDIIGFIKDRDTVLRQILTDAGVVIDAKNSQASITPALNDPTKINVIKVQTAADGWNTLQNTVVPNIAATNKAVLKQEGSVYRSGNLATDYRLHSGPIKGLRVGLGVNWRGGQILGNRGSDTIVDPNNPNNAIPDPAGGVDKYVYSKPFYKATGTLSYTYKLKEVRRYLPKTVQFDLAIDNLFNRGAPVYGSSGTTSTALSAATFIAPRNNDISNPSRVTIAGNPSYLPPRNYMLTARMDF